MLPRDNYDASRQATQLVLLSTNLEHRPYHCRLADGLEIHHRWLHVVWRLACMPLELRLRGKSTRQSHGTPIYYVDITLREGLDLEETLAKAHDMAMDRESNGLIPTHSLTEKLTQRSQRLVSKPAPFEDGELGTTDSQEVIERIL